MKTCVGNGNLEIVFPLRTKKIPLDSIKAVKPYQITMNFVCVFGSSAFGGWWGWFRNQELGRFMVYAANLDHVFFVELENGKRYVISCADSQTMTEAILKAKVS